MRAVTTVTITSNVCKTKRCRMKNFGMIHVSYHQRAAAQVLFQVSVDAEQSHVLKKKERRRSEE